MIIHELIKDIVLVFISIGIFFVLSKLNNSLYRTAFGKNLSLKENYYGKYFLKNVLHTLFTRRVSNKIDFYLISFILLVGIFLFPFTSDVWISGKFFKTNIINLKKDFIALFVLLISVNIIEIYSVFLKNYKKINDFIVSKLFFNMVLIINTITLIFFFRSLEIVNIIQFQEGATGQFFGNLTLIKNPFLFFSTFFNFLIFLQGHKNKKEPDDIIVEFLKNVMVTFYITYFFLGGYSILFLPEDFLDNLPFIYNLSQLISVIIKMLIIYVSLRFFRNKIKSYSSLSFRNFYFKLITMLTIISFMFELTRESLHGIV